MKTLGIYCAVFAVAGALCALIYAFMREPRFFCEANLVVEGKALPAGGTAELARQMHQKPFLIEAASKSGGILGWVSEDAVQKLARVEPIGEKHLRLSYTARDPQEAGSFLRSWVDCFQEESGRVVDRNQKKELERLRERLGAEEVAVERAEDALHSFLTGKAGVPPDQASIAVEGIARGGRLARMMSEQNEKEERAISDIEARMKSCAMRQKSLEKTLAAEQNYIVTFELKEENPVVRDLTQQLAEKQMQLQRLRVDATDRHPMRARLEQEVTKIEELLKNKPRESVKEQKIEINPVYKDIALELSKTRRAGDELAGQLELRRAALEEGRKRLASIASSERQLLPMATELRARRASMENLRSLLKETERHYSERSQSRALEIIDMSAPIPLYAAHRMRVLIAAGAVAGAAVGGGVGGISLLLRRRRPRPDS